MTSGLGCRTGEPHQKQQQEPSECSRRSRTDSVWRTGRTVPDRLGCLWEQLEGSRPVVCQLARRVGPRAAWWRDRQRRAWPALWWEPMPRETMRQRATSRRQQTNLQALQPVQRSESATLRLQRDPQSRTPESKTPRGWQPQHHRTNRLELRQRWDPLLEPLPLRQRAHRQTLPFCLPHRRGHLHLRWRPTDRTCSYLRQPESQRLV